MRNSLFPDIDKEIEEFKRKAYDEFEKEIKQSEMVVANHGIECDYIISRLCHVCKKYPECDTNLAFEAGEPQEEIRQNDKEIFCVILKKEKLASSLGADNE